MNTESSELKLIEDLFYAALALDEVGRTQLLATQPAAVCEEVTALLDEDRRGSVVARAVRGAAASLAQDRKVASPVGTRVGAYDIQKELGSGGMGSVYLGVRADETYQRQVAIKFVRAEYDTALFRERFQHERRILGRLDHPNIARLLDAGANVKGQPYFVMEFVDGEPITTYARKHDLSRSARLAIFNKVCEAVQYAHQNLIVHRDLKPGNILVDAAGNPKLLDFGIAKIVSSEGVQTDQTVAAGLRLLTPDYASPEHVAGLAVTTSSDIYSLGAILHELLLDTRPDRLTEGNNEIAPARALGADLGGIVRKAMHRQPEARYASASELREDILRHLNGRQIRARSYSLPERVMQFARQYRGFLAASLLVIGGLAAAATISLRAAHTAEQARLEAVVERNRAETERQRAEAALVRAEDSRKEAIAHSREAGIQKTAAEQEREIAHTRFNEQRELLGKFIEEVQDKIEGLPGSGPAREQSLTLSMNYLENMAKDRDASAAVRHHLALAYLRLGDLRGGPTTTNHQSDPRGAVALYTKADAILSQPGMRADPASLAVLVRLRSRQAQLSQYFGDRKAAQIALNEGIQIGRQLLAKASANDHEAAVPLIRVLNTAALQSVQNRNIEQALAQAVECRTLASQVTQTPVIADYLATCMTMEGRGYWLLPDLPKAVETFRNVIGLREAYLQQYPANNVNRRDLMLVFGHLSGALYSTTRPSMNDLPASVRALDQAREHAMRILQSDPSDRLAQTDLAMSTSRYGSVLVSDKQYEKAIGQLEEAVRMLVPLSRLLPDDTGLRLERIFALHRLAMAYQELPDRRSEVVGTLRRAVSASEELANFPGLTASAYENMSTVFLKLAKALRPTAPAEADRFQARAIEIFAAGLKRYPTSAEMLAFQKRELAGQ